MTTTMPTTQEELKPGYKVCVHCLKAKPVKTGFHTYPDGTVNQNCRRCHAKLHGFKPTRAKNEMSPAFKKTVREHYHSSCHKCGSKENLEIHHKVPVSAGGAKTSLLNVVLLCTKCHRAEHAKGGSMSHETLARNQLKRSSRKVPDAMVFAPHKDYEKRMQMMKA